MTQGQPPLTPTPARANQPHRPAGDTEEVYFEGSPLLRGEMGKGIIWMLAGLVLIALPVVIKVYHDQFPPAWVSAALILIGLLLFFAPYLQTKRYRYRITNYRIDFERGLLGRNIDTLELWHVEDLRFHQSLWDRMLGVGTITVLSKHPTSPMLVIRGIPNAAALFKTLEQRVIAVKRQAGVIKVDSGTMGPATG